MARKYVSWTKQEWTRLSDLTWAIRQNNPGKKLQKLIRMALQQFPQDRIRGVNADVVERVRSGLAYRDRLAEDAKKRDAATPVTENVIETKPLKVLISKESPLESQDTAELVSELAKRAVHAFSGRGSSLLDALIATLSKGESVADAIILAAQAIATTPTPAKEKPVVAAPAQSCHVPVPPPQAKPSVAQKSDKVRVVLVGGLAIQQQEIASRVADIAKIRFIDKNQVTDLGLSCGSQDIIAIMSSFVDHSIVRQIENKANGARILQLKGNASGVSRDLRAAILDPNYRPCYHS